MSYVLGKEPETRRIMGFEGGPSEGLQASRDKTFRVGASFEVLWERGAQIEPLLEGFNGFRVCYQSVGRASDCYQWAVWARRDRNIGATISSSLLVARSVIEPLYSSSMPSKILVASS